MSPLLPREEEIAEAAFLAYKRAVERQVDPKFLAVLPWPASWSEANVDVQANWRAVARAVLACLQPVA
jgi:hypothetical protein